ncbi:MAG TPA: glycosyltransferase family 2 protein [Candidatus Saccharimonadales bacterium]|nr:glycosyltransferase family 2 protein [Candidatus Saccharimonadales bacterium]
MPVSLMVNESTTIVTFVMPVFLDKGEQSIVWLDKTVDSVLAQTDPNWQLIMVNDCSPYPKTAAELERLSAKDSRIHAINLPANQGPGGTRNAGINWARDHGSEYIAFLDADDICHPRRAEVIRSIMDHDPSVGVVYSTFIVIDENDNKVAWGKLSGPIQEILECNQNNPPQGETAWIDIGTMTGYANLTSSTAVRVGIAIKHPFADVITGEDAHAWLRYAGEGKKFVYTPDIPTLYRIPQKAGHSAMRDRVGGIEVFYTGQCKVGRDGFETAFNVAVANGKVKPQEKERLLARYHVRTAETMRQADQLHLAKNEIKRAREISPQFAKEWIDFLGYDWAK